MLELTRETIAYGLIGALVMTATVALVRITRRRRRRALRQRGIKSYTH